MHTEKDPHSGPTDWHGGQGWKKNHHSRTGRILGGLIVVGVGIILLARASGVYFPEWLFTWQTFLIVLGLYIGARHSFKKFGWIFPVIIGSLFMVHEFFPETNLKPFIWPVVIIVAGIFVMFKPSRRSWKKKEIFFEDSTENTGEDMIDSSSIFGSVKKNIISKNFGGGKITNVFGGAEINLMQADIQGTAVLDISQVFGGTSLIIPPHWQLRSEIVAILGGVEDKRFHQKEDLGSHKILIIKGTTIFGGIDIKSY